MDPGSGRTLEAGRTLGHYRLLERIGVGGMGEVWRARDERLERDVALKVLLPGTLADEAARKRFRREALALSKLSHPGIATVFDFDSEGGHDFLVMEYVSGAMIGAQRGKGAHAETEVVRLGLQLAEGLAAAHAEGIVHRDLKPANVRLTADGRLKLLDFGLAHLARPAGDDAGSAAPTQSASMTEAGALVGTLGYMAPEQVRGEKADARADLWAAGLVLYELATGRAAYAHAETAPLLHAILNESVALPRKANPRVSPALEAIILKCVEKEPAKRYASARELAADLQRLQGGLGVAAERARARTQRLRRLAVAGPVAVMLVLVALTALDVGGLRTRLFAPAPIRSIAVLPLANLSGDPDQEYFADGMTEELINRLAGVSALRVTSRSSIMTFKDAKLAIPEIARRLKVDGVIEGSVQRAGDRVRVTVQLVRGATDRNLWGSSYERDAADVFALQSEVAQAITSQIRIAVTPGEQTRLASSRRVDPAANEEYLKGRFYLNKFTVPGSRKALAHFQRALEADPGFAPAQVGVANAYYQLSTQDLPPEVAMPKVRAAAARALDLDPNLAGAYAARACVSAFYDWHWREAEADFRRAIELNPLDEVVYQSYGNMLVCLGRFEDATRVLAKAQEIDPLSTATASFQLWPLYEGRRYDEAIAAARRMIAEDSTAWNAYGVLSQALTQTGRLDEADRVTREAARRSLSDPTSGSLGYTLALRGRRAEALKEIEPVVRSGVGDGYSVAMVYAAIGMKDEAFAWLEKEMQARRETVIFLKVDPAADPLRSDPRFAGLMRRLGFER